MLLLVFIIHCFNNVVLLDKIAGSYLDMLSKDIGSNTYKSLDVSSCIEVNNFFSSSSFEIRTSNTKCNYHSLFRPDISLSRSLIFMDGVTERHQLFMLVYLSLRKSILCEIPSNFFDMSKTFEHDYPCLDVMARTDPTL